MTARRAWPVFVSLALCTRHTDASCTDHTPVNACILAYSSVSGSTVVAQRCTGIQTYMSCLEEWEATCNDATVTDPYVATFNTAKTSSCASICKEQAVCATSSVTVTVTVTPWDSSASSSAGKTSSASTLSQSLNQGSSASDLSKSAGSLKSTASGSSGSYLQIWQWLIVLACCSASAFAAPWMMRKPRRKKKAPSRSTDFAPEHEALPIFEPLSPNLAKTQTMSVVPKPQYVPSQQHYLQTPTILPGYGFAVPSTASQLMAAPVPGYTPASSGMSVPMPSYTSAASSGMAASMPGYPSAAASSGMAAPMPGYASAVPMGMEAAVPVYAFADPP